MKVIEAKSFSDLYRKGLENLLKNPEYETAPRDMKIKEIIDGILVLKNPLSNSFHNSVRSPDLNYMAGELLWYFSGRNDVEFISKYSKFWSGLMNSDGTANSAYGNLLFTQKNKLGLSQWEWAYESLKRDKDTRQAIMHFNNSSHQDFKTKDFVCTLNGVFTIRDNKLSLSVIMRSNDIHFGLIYDLPFFTLLLQQMRLQLLPIYPDLEIGTYTHHAVSLHVYERNFKLLNEMLDGEWKQDAIPELDVNLITTSGKMTPELMDCFNAIQNNEEYVTESKFLNWLYHSAK